ncbi:MAG: SRPBCC family protein [Methylotenera sp.]|nr:SRPBCC family protein [Methylotenera sp.]
MLNKPYRSLMTTTLIAVIFSPFCASACGPSPQKVSKEIVIQASPKKVWALVGDFSAMQKWHPDVLASSLESRPDADEKTFIYRTLTLKNGGSIIERQRETQAGEMKLGAVLVQGDLAVSNYSDAISVKPSLVAGESVVTWVGRFNNKANLMQAPAGQDNVAAITTVEAWYAAGLANLKIVLEAQ